MGCGPHGLSERGVSARKCLGLLTIEPKNIKKGVCLGKRPQTFGGVLVRPLPRGGETV